MYWFKGFDRKKEYCQRIESLNSTTRAKCFRKVPDFGANLEASSFPFEFGRIKN